jgi:hypothetical protein
MLSSRSLQDTHMANDPDWPWPLFQKENFSQRGGTHAEH